MIDIAPQATLERRILIVAPTAKDGEIARSVLGRAGIECQVCPDLDSLWRQLDSGAAAVLLPEELIAQDHWHRLQAWLSRQPTWSDLPLLVLARPGADSAALAEAVELLGNVTVLERPTRISGLVSAVQTALRARLRQYQIRDYLVERQRTEIELRDADRRKDEFLAILAHELRNPLAPIRNSLHILRLTGRHDATAERVGEMIERQVNHIVRLVDDLLEVSRINRGKIELRRQRVELREVLHNAVETSRPLIDAARHRLEISLPAESLVVDADPVRLSQVFANLLNNAAKYTDRGGHIWLTATPQAGSVAVSVKDTGMGIPADMLPHVFELFTQVDRSAAHAQGGLGIGLTLVKSLVELHGATVEVRSEGPGRGSEFVVRMPIATASREQSEQPGGNGAPVRLLRRFLVVDDNRDAAASLGTLLKLMGAEVHVAYSGREALAALDAYRPAVILLDIGMPDMDGYEVARRIRRRPEFRKVMLIALSGWGQNEDRRRSEQAGFDFHMVKPADIGTLETLLNARGPDAGLEHTAS